MISDRTPRPPAGPEIAFDRACALMESVLSGSVRQEILTEVSKSTHSGPALPRLRDSLRANVLKTGTGQVNLDRVVRAYDRRTRADHFHVLHDWDGKADKVNENTIVVDVLHYLIDQRGSGHSDRTALAILLDYYFLYVLALLSLRVWDDGLADANVDRLNTLLQHLQGPNGSGQTFAENAETLLLIATSHYELDQHGYDALLARVRTLGGSQRTNVALGHAVSMGCHLRFGFEATYGKDPAAMRNDNIADYPWLCFALVTLMREYGRLHEAGIGGRERETIVEAILNGLSADPASFVGDPPDFLADCEVERSEFRELFRKYRQDLIKEFERYRPSEHAYSPLSFFFNFSQNVLKGTVIDALLWGEPWRVTLNDLLTGIPAGEPSADTKQKLARTLMGYARTSPDRIRGRLMPVIVYDPQAGQRAFATTLRAIQD